MSVFAFRMLVGTLVLCALMSLVGSVYFKKEGCTFKYKGMLQLFITYSIMAVVVLIIFK